MEFKMIKGRGWSLVKLISVDACRFMVGLTVKPELPHVDIDLSNEQDVNRYYNYICNGVDTILTAQIQADVLEDILKLIPYSLRDRFNYYTEDLLVEIKEGFTRNIKKAILQFALRDPLQEHRLEVRAASLLFHQFSECIGWLVSQGTLSISAGGGG